MTILLWQNLTDKGGQSLDCHRQENSLRESPPDGPSDPPLKRRKESSLTGSLEN